MKNRFIYSLLIASLAATWSSCGRDSETKVANITTADTKAAGAINEIVDTVTYIGIDYGEIQPIGRMVKLADVGEAIAIFDSGNSRIVTVDKETGKILHTIDRRGQGPEEYLELSAFCADSSGIYIADNVRRKLLHYDKSDGSFLSSADMPLIADDMERFGGQGFIFACVPLENAEKTLLPSRHRLFVTDGDLKITDALFAYGEEEHDPIGQRFFLSRNGNDIVFGSLMINGFTTIHDGRTDSITQTVFSFDRPVAPGVSLEEVDDYQFLTDTPIKAGPYYYVRYFDGNGRGISGVLNSATNQFLTNDTSDMTKVMGPIIGSGDGCMIMQVTGEMYGYMKADGFTPAPAEVEAILADEGDALAIYHLK